MKIEGFWIASALYSIVLGLLSKLGWDMKKKLDDTYSKDEVRQLISDKLDPLRVDMKNIKEDITEMKQDVKTLVNHSSKK